MAALVTATPTGADLLPGPVVLVRPDRNEADAAALRDAGFTVLVEPYLSVTTADDPAPALALLDVLDPRPVSYTHLDVYKRQTPSGSANSPEWRRCAASSS